MLSLLRFVPLVGLVLLASAAGCERRAALVAPPPAKLVVPVSLPVQRLVTEYADYPGRTEAVQLVEVRPRVTGYLTAMPYQEGAVVKTGAVLFEIDDRPYQAALEQARGEVEKQRAAVVKTTANYDIAVKVQKDNPGAISQQELTSRKGARDEAAGALQVALAAQTTAQLNVDWCKVRSPIDGQTSRYQLTVGNLVTQDKTLLTTVVSLEPIYAYFNMDEPTLERFKLAVNAGKIQPDLETANLPVSLGLQTDDGYPHRGTVNFINNQVNPSTGTIAVRGVFPNPRPAGGTWLLTPGMFVRIRLPLGPPRPALLVVDRALGMDQGLRFLYVVDAENRVQYRRVRTGPLQEDGLRVVADGLQATDRVVISRLQQVRPHLVVDPEPMAMPTSGPPARDAAGGPGGGQP